MAGTADARRRQLRDLTVDVDPNAVIALDNDGTMALINGQARDAFALSDTDVGRPFRDLEISYRPTELRSVISENHSRSTLNVDDAKLGSLIAFDLSEHRLSRLVQVGEALVRVLAADARGGVAEHDVAVTVTDLVDHHYVVHRAAGMLSEQLACSVDDALARLRARAFVEDLRPTELARRLLDREAGFDD